MPSPKPFLSRLTGAVRGVFAPRASEPFDGRPQDQGPAKIPTPAWSSDQPMAPPPGGTPFERGYHDRTFVTAVPSPISFGGITLDVARNYVDQHDSGVSFYGSAVLAVAMTRFPEVYSALGVRCAPSISLPRQIVGGSRGLARIVREETELSICPPANRPSPCWPATLWGAIEIDLAMQGFFVLQHVYGKPDKRGIRRMYTRRWPTWAVWYNAYRKTYIALTTAGSIDILNDGKFTIGGKTDIPHLQGALRSLLLPVFDGSQVIQARANWIDKYSDPKWLGEMPEGQGPRSPEGKAFYEAMRTMQAPGGVGAFPHGSKVTIQGLSAEASAAFKEALDSDNSYVGKVLTGLDTNASGGVYKPKDFWGILHSTVGDDIAATVRSVNIAIAHETRFNYGDALAEKDYPALEIPLPDPEADARYDAAAKRQRAYTDQLVADRAAGLVVDADRNAELAAIAGAEPGVLAEKSSSPKPPIDAAPTDVVKVFTVDEVRASRGYDAIGGDRGKLTIPELDARATAQPAPEGEPAKTPDPAQPDAPKEESPPA